jgi:hypothetical protein
VQDGTPSLSRLQSVEFMSHELEWIGKEWVLAELGYFVYIFVEGLMRITKEDGSCSCLCERFELGTSAIRVYGVAATLSDSKKCLR